METIDERERFQYWLADMDDALERFLSRLPADLRSKLDFSPASLDALESWILERYGAPHDHDLLEPAESAVLDGLGRYIGETFRRALGGGWEIRLDDPKYAFHGLPQLAGFHPNSSPVSPMSLATAATDRRTGRYLSTVLAAHARAAARHRK